MKGKESHNKKGKRKELEYTIIVPKSLPMDLCERISKIHASAILHSRHADEDAQKDGQVSAANIQSKGVRK